MTPDYGGHELNRKTKKRIKTVAVAVFFLVAGTGYFLWDDFAAGKKKEAAELTGVLELAVTGAPEGHYAEQQSFDEPVQEPEELLGGHGGGAVGERGEGLLDVRRRRLLGDGELAIEVPEHFVVVRNGTHCYMQS